MIRIQLHALLGSASPYSLYVLLILMVVYLLNQLDRFVLGIAGKSLARDLEFGQLSCYLNISHSDNNSCDTTCNGIQTENECEITDGCMWDFTATGIQYEVLAGPAFTLFFTLVALPLGLLAGAPRVNRKLAIALCLVMWSGMTLAASFTLSFWQLLLTRIGLGIFEAVCTPFASSIISDLFQQHRATALGFYNWGIYIGYSLAFAFNFILMATDWRWTFRIAAMPGFLVGVIMLLTVREPPRSKQTTSGRVAARGQNLVVQLLWSVLKPWMLILCLAGGIRQGGGLVWAYNVKSYFALYYCSSVSVGTYLSWVPLVGGTLGAVCGGLISDKLVQRRGPTARLWVLIISQLLACPFLVGAVFLPPDPWAFLCLLPAYIIGEVWIGVCLAVVIELVPHRIVAAAVAFFLFVINNIGGSLPLLIPSLEAKINLRYTLLILFPGSYLIAAGLFAVVLVVVNSSKCCTLPCHKNGTQVLDDEQTYLIQVGDEPSITVEEEILGSQEPIIVVRTKRSRSYISES